MSIVTNGWGVGAITAFGFGAEELEISFIPIVKTFFDFGPYVNSCADIREKTSPLHIRSDKSRVIQRTKGDASIRYSGWLCDNE